MGLKRFLAPLLALVVVSAVVLGLVTGVLGSLARDGLEAAGLGSRTSARPPLVGPSAPGTVPSASPTAAPATPPSGSQPAVPALPAPVLATAPAGPPPDAAALAARVRAVKVKGSGGYSGEVRDVTTGRVLFAHDAGRGAIPASTTKLLTATAALATLGPEHRFTTRLVSPARGQVVLVGGGDPYLEASRRPGDEPARASLADLARAGAKALRADGVTTVGLGYDASRFSGPAWNPTWPDSYGDVATPVSALWVNEGRVVPRGGVTGPRVADPARVAASAFAAALEKQGIDVRAVRPTRAPRSAATVASVSSMTVAQVVEHVLMTSDNDGAEVLLRQVAVGAGHPGTFAEGTAAVRTVLTRLRVWRPGTVLHDGSGLSRQTRVPADGMVQVLRAAAQPGHPELRAVLTGLPVAGVEGSLATKFGDDESLAGRGVVRGKTGTLSKVHALAGVLRTRDGSLLAYAFLVNDPGNEYNATVWLQRVTAALAGCGCR